MDGVSCSCSSESTSLRERSTVPVRAEYCVGTVKESQFNSSTALSPDCPQKASFRSLRLSYTPLVYTREVGDGPCAKSRSAFLRFAAESALEPRTCCGGVLLYRARVAYPVYTDQWSFKFGLKQSTTGTFPILIPYLLACSRKVSHDLAFVLAIVSFGSMSIASPHEAAVTAIELPEQGREIHPHRRDPVSPSQALSQDPSRESDGELSDVIVTDLHAYR